MHAADGLAARLVHSARISQNQAHCSPTSLASAQCEGRHVAVLKPEPLMDFVAFCRRAAAGEAHAV